ncbi:beta-ketoacyl synthase N-terminal-like domain-containing protein [Streptomyces sp. P9(2023)]|uniref:beta-ketoacyl synthase N-terminal-like domain-containing protein n=1 Tax=Streptomyces sp. P9(2023) TaxID=3064394 RepID=UPI0028F41E45|nr:beta-ketoacyl synthase N-terminal-like domain-containing protein [Streptomyces sp. P9(2023)]MDT9692115.1 beta-ketoacyl synthase N-terminal-like domain-containing protein [Streptomyces sp. P9(2023)]
MSDVVISGMGLLTPFGRGVGTYWRALTGGRTALAPARRFTSPVYRGEPVGEVTEFELGDAPRKQVFASAAAEDALLAARLPRVPDGALVILVGQAPPPADGSPLGAENREFLGPGADGILAGGDSLHLTHACASTLFAIAFAHEALRAGSAPAVVIAGATALNHYEYASMDVVRAVDRAACRPFDTGRGGISLGEGGGALVLETADRARARGLEPDIIVAGTGCRVAAGKSVASDETSIAECLREALDAARADRLDYVHAHATGTAQGDTAELHALEAVVGERAWDGVPVSSHKGAIGHMLHISGAPGVSAAAMALRTGVGPPTAGLRTPEEARRLRLPKTPLVIPGATFAAVNSFGFGGNNATVVLRRR